MDKVKENKGITLAVLAVTIILILIIAGTTIYIGTDNIEKTKDELLVSELKQVQNFVAQRYLDYMIVKEPSILIGTKLTDSEIAMVKELINIETIEIPEKYDENVKSFYRLTPTQLELIGIEECRNTYVVNYLTGEVINETEPTTSSGEKLYTYLKNSFNNNDITAF